jgi:glycosyltransferase involved in cell wall biosynthesis
VPDLPPLLSVCIVNFNYERFVGEAIESALSQTYDHVEVVVVDDGSTDGSRDVIARYGDLVRPVFKENGGHSSACDAGFAAAAGDVVMFLDSDDVLLPDVGRRVMHEFAAQPGLAKAQFRLAVVDGDLRPTGEVHPSPRWWMPSGDLRGVAQRFRTYVWPPASGSAYSRESLSRVLPVPDDFPWHADAYLAAMSVLCGPIASLREPGALYRMHGTNHSLTEGFQRLVADEIGKIEVIHRHARRLATELGLRGYPERPEDFLDFAFDGYRLASLRLWGPEQHPVAGDRLAPLAFKAARSALAHPHHPRVSKLKRVAWCGAMLCAPRGLAERLSRQWIRPEHSTTAVTPA